MDDITKAEKKALGKYYKSGKKLTEIYVKTEKKQSAKIMEGINEVVIVFSICDEVAEKKPAHNKTTDVAIQLMVELLKNGFTPQKIAELLETTSQNVNAQRRKVENQEKGNEE